MDATTLTVVVPVGYGVILVEIVVIVMMYTFAGFAVGKARRRYFTKEFFAKNFPELQPHPVGGYPDTGSGRFADKLPMDQWISFNNIQRAHLNFLEQLPVILSLLLIAGIVYTKITAVCGLVYIVGRVLYIQAYHSTTRAPTRFQSLVFIPMLYTLMMCSVLTSINLTGGLSGFLTFAHSYIK